MIAILKLMVLHVNLIWLKIYQSSNLDSMSPIWCLPFLFRPLQWLWNVGMCNVSVLLQVLGFSLKTQMSNLIYVCNYQYSLKLKTGHARGTNKTTGNARLSPSSASASENCGAANSTRLINSDGCVQESQLVGLNHYLAAAHLTFSFSLKKPSL